MPGELLRFAEDLNSLHKGFPEVTTVNFEPAEPKILLRYTIARTGLIEGTYAVSSDLVRRAVLTGSFSMDQSYLPGLVSALRKFVRQATDAA